MSIRFRENLKYAYVQGGALTDNMAAVRTNLTEATDMIPPPAAVKPAKGDPTGKIDFGAVSKRLLAAQTGPSVPGAALNDHPVLGRYVFECTCGTQNFRTHDASCPCYTWLPLVEVALARMDDTPEDWYLRRQGLQQPATPPQPPPVTAPPFIPPSNSGSMTAADSDPWVVPVQKPPAIAWDTKSPAHWDAGEPA